MSMKLPLCLDRARACGEMMLKDSQHRWMRVFAPVVWLALVQVFIISMLASSPGWHECVHADAHDSDHHCLATDFKSGLIEQALVIPVRAPSFVPVSCEIVVPAAAVRSSLPVHLCGSLLEHGPPALA